MAVERFFERAGEARAAGRGDILEITLEVFDFARSGAVERAAGELDGARVAGDRVPEDDLELAVGAKLGDRLVSRGLEGVEEVARGVAAVQEENDAGGW